MKTGSLEFNKSTILDGLTLNKINELNIMSCTINGDINCYFEKENSQIQFYDTVHYGNIKVTSGGKVSIYLKNIEANLLELGKKEKDHFPYFYQKINILGEKTFIRKLEIRNVSVEKTFTMNNVELDYLYANNTVFKNKVEIKENNIKKIASFKNVKFIKLCDFYKTKFFCNSFEKTSFEDISVFTESTFNKPVDFKYTTFGKLAQFKNAIFEKKLNLEDTIIKEEANFLGIKQKDNKNLQAENIANRETARVIKNSFEKQNNIIEANKFYALEMEKRKEELNDNKENWVDKLIFNIHGLSSNHSQSPLKALFWILIIAFISATVDFFSMAQNGIFIHCKSYLLLGLTMFVPILFYIAHMIKDNFFTFSVLALFLMGSSYYLITKDVHFYLLAKTLNPFKAISSEDINICQLFLKIILGYLYYQFIISIRQNTRRK